jgi:hypothetical protein
VLGATAVAAQAAAPRCSAGQLAGKVRQTSGAAGTTAVAIAIRNISPAACSLRGFPGLKLRNAAGQLPTLVRHGGLAILERPVRTITLDPGERASLLVAFSNIPQGGETTCRHATRLVVVLRHGLGRFSLAFAASPCNGGRLHISPFLRGLRGV